MNVETVHRVMSDLDPFICSNIWRMKPAAQLCEKLEIRQIYFVMSLNLHSSY